MNLQDRNARIRRHLSHLNELESLRGLMTKQRANWLEQEIDKTKKLISAAVIELTNHLKDRRAYWTIGEKVGPPLFKFQQMCYFPIENALPDLDLALDSALLDCNADVPRTIMEYEDAAKIWMTVQVRFEPANPEDDERHEFYQFLSATDTRYFRRDGQINGFSNPYSDVIRILTDRIKQHNAKFIRDKSGLRLSQILQLILKAAKYSPVAARCHTELPRFLKAKKALVNIENQDNWCFGYSMLYFLERPADTRNLKQSNKYTLEMFQRHHLDALPYPILPNNVHIYEERLEMNINVFSYFDDEGKARYPLHISKQNYLRTANLLYWNEHYALISSVLRLFSDITKYREPKYFCLRCLQHFSSEDVLMRHQKQCSREDFLSVLHVLPPTDSQDCELRYSAF